MTDKPESKNRRPESYRRSGLKLELPGLDKLHAVFITPPQSRVQASVISSELWINLLGFIILEIAIAVGWIAATGGRVSGNWKTALIALAAAALGFGAAHLLARRSSNFQGRELERHYEELKQRSARLLTTVDKFESRSGSSE